MILAPPLRFRFHPDDHAEYGDAWTTYDEAALVRLPARELADIEREIGMSVRSMIGRSRQGFANADLAQTWVARRLADPDVRPFAEWNPMVLLVDWEELPAPAGDVDPPEPPSSPAPSEE
ncbi:hypothetical protein [Micromonospora aurantiaca (nom. illeg.)]|uniref:hypothetical protein n=1 Tax=Micromonospora aurantiaca (nom. illeg.) TaxID=47850 RepID=UPI0033DA9D6F